MYKVDSFARILVSFISPLWSPLLPSPHFPSLSVTSLLLPYEFSPKVLHTWRAVLLQTNAVLLVFLIKLAETEDYSFLPASPSPCWFFPSIPTLLTKIHNSQAAPDFAESGMALWYCPRCSFPQMIVLGPSPCSESSFAHPHLLE